MDFCKSNVLDVFSDTEERVSHIELHHSNSAVSRNGQAPLQLCLNHERGRRMRATAVQLWADRLTRTLHQHLETRLVLRPYTRECTTGITCARVARYQGQGVE